MPPYRIVVVDDSAIIRSVLVKTIRMTGLPIGEIAEAGNGRQALEALRASPAALLITDINMPEMDGIELIEAVRNDPRLAPLPVLVISAHGNERIQREIEHHRVDGFLRKPFMPEEVRDLLGRVLGGATA